MALTGSETLQVLGQNPAGVPAATTFQTTTGAIAALASTQETVAPAVTAHAGGGQTSATLLTASFNNITTVANAADSVKLPPSSVGTTITVSNQGANAAQIFGTSPDTINSVATGTGISIPVGAIFVFTCAVVGNWLQNVQTGGAFTGTFDGVLGGNTPAAATVTTLATTGAISGGSSSNIAINTNKFTVAASSGNTVIAGTLAQQGTVTLSDAVNVVLNATTGTKFGTATTQKLAFFNSTPVVQPAGTGNVTGFVAGSGTASKSDSVWAGAAGASAYTVGDIVTALKALGFLAA